MRKPGDTWATFLLRVQHYERAATDYAETGQTIKAIQAVEMLEASARQARWMLMYRAGILPLAETEN